MKEIRAIVIADRSEVVLLQWRELESVEIMMIDGEVMEVPTYGRLLAQVSRPRQEFQEFIDYGGTLVEYMEEYLPRPSPDA